MYLTYLDKDDLDDKTVFKEQPNIPYLRVPNMILCNEKKNIWITTPPEYFLAQLVTIPRSLQNDLCHGLLLQSYRYWVLMKESLHRRRRQIGIK